MIRARLYPQNNSSTAITRFQILSAARVDKEMRFISLLHVSANLLPASFHSLKRKAALTVGGATWLEYSPGRKVGSARGYQANWYPYRDPHGRWTGVHFAEPWPTFGE
jgi:hypothetical protein